MTRSPSALWLDAPREHDRSRGRSRRASRRSRLASVGLFSAATLAVAVALLHLAPSGSPDAEAPVPLLVRLDRLAGDLGLGLDQLEISGHRFTADSDIIDAVGLAEVRSFVTFDPKAARARIERLPWIDTAVIERLPPDRLIVRVTERRPLAAWERDGRDVLIDATGRQLTSVARGQAPNLPRLAGDQAPEDAARILALVATHPDLAGRLERAERVAGRRWRLVLRDAPVIELPAEADGAALAMLFETGAHGRLFDLAASVIDMTVLRRITIRPPAHRKRT